MPDIEGVPYESTGGPMNQPTAERLATLGREWASAGVSAASAAIAPVQSQVSALSSRVDSQDAKTLASAKAYTDTKVAGISPLPSGGTTGQVLTKTATGEVWADPKGEKGDPGKDGADWSKDQQAKAQGYWIVVSPTEPESPTYETADGTVVPVIWQKPIMKAVPVLPQTPAFSRASSSLTVPDLVGVQYRLTGWSKDGGATWTTVSKDLAGGAVTDVKAATGQSLPVTVRVEAFAEPGYTLPNTYRWTFDYPDPNATVVVTSDAFTGADVASTHTRMTDATLGGTAKQWTDTVGAFQVLDGKLIQVGRTGQAHLPAGAFNMEVEFDLVRTDGVTTGSVPLDQIQVMIGSTGGWGNGFGLNGNRLYENSTNLSDVNESWYIGPTPGLGELGHYKMSVIGQTGRVTVPNGSTYTAQLTETRTATQTGFSVMGWSGTSPTYGIDNLVIKQVGY